MYTRYLREGFTQARDGKLASSGAELEAERAARRQAYAALEALQQKLGQQGEAAGKQVRPPAGLWSCLNRI